jgi:hypothetical protein
MIVVVQLVLSMFVAGAVMPAVLFSVPSARQSHVGVVVTIAVVLAVFGVLRLVWPRRRQP